jgi:hypothetical protein
MLWCSETILYKFTPESGCFGRKELDIGAGCLCGKVGGRGAVILLKKTVIFPQPKELHSLLKS